jgi:oligopeptide/dipeptide ABC transporter ATP-binding protein
MSARPLLSVRGLVKHFPIRRGALQRQVGAVRAVDGVDLDVFAGECVALVGESGSGKTTLGRATLRLVPLSDGRIEFEGTPLDAITGPLEKAFRQRAQAIFQDPFSSLSPYMRVQQLVEEPLLIHGTSSASERRDRVIAALELVKLRPAAEFAAKYPHTLSGGQRQRVSIARAMILDPDYLVADEPVSMIDASSRAEILYLLAELQERNALTFLVITHDLASARHFADRIAVMYAGRIVELASASELVEDPKHPYTRALLAAVPEADPANRTRRRPVVSGEPPDPSALPAGCAFHPRCPVAVTGLSESVVPPLIELSPGHLVACHRYPAADGVGAPPQAEPSAAKETRVGAT